MIGLTVLFVLMFREGAKVNPFTRQLSFDLIRLKNT